MVQRADSKLAPLPLGSTGSGSAPRALGSPGKMYEIEDVKKGCDAVTQSDLHQTLGDLQKEIDRTQTDDPEKRAALDGIQTHVQKVLDEPEGGHHLALSDRLEKTVILFESDHPSLARAMEITVNSLSAMGI